LHIVQLMLLHPKTSSSLASYKCRLVLPFRYWLATQLNRVLWTQVSDTSKSASSLYTIINKQYHLMTSSDRFPVRGGATVLKVEGTKCDSRTKRAEKNFVPPTFGKVGVQFFWLSSHHVTVTAFMFTILHILFILLHYPI